MVNGAEDGGTNGEWGRGRRHQMIDLTSWRKAEEFLSLETFHTNNPFSSKINSPY